jgi:hypothetical protein
MRITIEIDEKAAKVESTEELAVEFGAEEALDAGAPSVELLGLVQGEVSELAATPGVQDVVAAGSPPQWLHEAMEQAGPTGIGADMVGPGDAGAAPVTQE